jgi:hypothetical protein
MSESPSQPSADEFDPSREPPVDEEEPHPSVDTPRAALTPTFRWLRPLSEHGVILCTEHQTCYTPGSSLREHLLRKHSVKGQRAKEVENWVAAQKIAKIVTIPSDYSPFIHGL